jgi:hypothetical protein
MGLLHAGAWAALEQVQKTAAGAVFETGKTGPVNR